MLTRKQHELLMFIHERIKETGVSPSFDEMKEALDLASKSGIHRLITALEERGFIRRLAHRARALEVVKMPDQATAGAPRGRAGFTPGVIEGHEPRRTHVGCGLEPWAQRPRRLRVDRDRAERRELLEALAQLAVVAAVERGLRARPRRGGHRSRRRPRRSRPSWRCLPI